MKKCKTEVHKFYCSECGKEGIPLPRKKSHKHKTGHGKHLYCIYCKKETLHIER